MIIGITGPECSGKDTAGEYLAKKGFQYFSLSDQIRKECTRRGLDQNTPTLVRVANEMRTVQGNDILAKRALAGLDLTKDYIANSIRHPAEAAYLRDHGKLVLILLDAKPTVRFDRHRKRSDRSKYETYQQFLDADKAQQTSTDPAHQQLHAVFALANETIMNDEGLPALYKKLDLVIAKYRAQ